MHPPNLNVSKVYYEWFIGTGSFEDGVSAFKKLLEMNLAEALSLLNKLVEKKEMKLNLAMELFSDYCSRAEKTTDEEDLCDEIIDRICTRYKEEISNDLSAEFENLVFGLERIGASAPLEFLLNCRFSNGLLPLKEEDISFMRKTRCFSIYSFLIKKVVNTNKENLNALKSFRVELLNIQDFLFSELCLKINQDNDLIEGLKFLFNADELEEFYFELIKKFIYLLSVGPNDTLLTSKEIHDSVSELLEKISKKNLKIITQSLLNLLDKSKGKKFLTLVERLIIRQKKDGYSKSVLSLLAKRNNPDTFLSFVIEMIEDSHVNMAKKSKLIIFALHVSPKCKTIHSLQKLLDESFRIKCEKIMELGGLDDFYEKFCSVLIQGYRCLYSQKNTKNKFSGMSELEAFLSHFLVLVVDKKITMNWQTFLLNLLSINNSNFIKKLLIYMEKIIVSLLEDTSNSFQKMSVLFDVQTLCTEKCNKLKLNEVKWERQMKNLITYASLKFMAEPKEIALERMSECINLAFKIKTILRLSEDAFFHEILQVIFSQSELSLSVELFKMNILPILQATMEINKKIQVLLSMHSHMQNMTSTQFISGMFEFAGDILLKILESDLANKFIKQKILFEYIFFIPKTAPIQWFEEKKMKMQLLVDHAVSLNVLSSGESLYWQLYYYLEKPFGVVKSGRTRENGIAVSKVIYFLLESSSPTFAIHRIFQILVKLRSVLIHAKSKRLFFLFIKLVESIEQLDITDGEIRLILKKYPERLIGIAKLFILLDRHDYAKKIIEKGIEWLDKNEVKEIFNSMEIRDFNKEFNKMLTSLNSTSTAVCKESGYRKPDQTSQALEKLNSHLSDIIESQELYQKVFAIDRMIFLEAADIYISNSWTDFFLWEPLLQAASVLSDSKVLNEIIIKLDRNIKFKQDVFSNIIGTKSTFVDPLNFIFLFGKKCVLKSLKNFFISEESKTQIFMKLLKKFEKNILNTNEVEEYFGLPFFEFIVFINEIGFCFANAIKDPEKKERIGNKILKFGLDYLIHITKLKDLSKEVSGFLNVLEVVRVADRFEKSSEICMVLDLSIWESVFNYHFETLFIVFNISKTFPAKYIRIVASAQKILENKMQCRLRVFPATVQSLNDQLIKMLPKFDLNSYKNLSKDEQNLLAKILIEWLVYSKNVNLNTKVIQGNMESLKEIFSSTSFQIEFSHHTKGI